MHGQLTSFLRGRRKGLGSKLPVRSLGSREGTRPQERHGGQPNLREKSQQKSGVIQGHVGVIGLVRGRVLEICHLNCQGNSGKNSVFCRMQLQMELEMVNE